LWFPRGGGPTGVEFAAELHDLLHAEIARHYPTLAPMANISLYDVAPSILGSFDQSLVQYVGFARTNMLLSLTYFLRYTEKTFQREGISVYTSHHVQRVESVSFLSCPLVCQSAHAIKH